MVWVKTSDDMPDNPKIRSLSPTAACLYFFGLHRCNSWLTDGWIGTEQVCEVFRPFGKKLRLKAAVGELVKQRLWDVADGGYRVHDFEQYQPSAQEVARSREQARLRGARRRDADRAAKLTEKRLKTERLTAQSQRNSDMRKQPTGHTTSDFTEASRRDARTQPDPAPETRREISPSIAASADPAPTAAAAFSTSGATSSAAAQVDAAQAPAPRVSPASPPADAPQPANGHTDKAQPPHASPVAAQGPQPSPVPEPPAEAPPAATQALVAARPASLAAAEEPPPHGELLAPPGTPPPTAAAPSLAVAYDAQRAEWLQRRVTSVPDGAPLSAGQLTLALCQDLQLGIDVHMAPRHRAAIAEMAGTATATHVQLAWVETVAVASQKRDTPGMGLLLKILARVARQHVMPQTQDDWVLDGAAEKVSFSLEFRRKVAAMRAEEEAMAARKAAGVR